MAAFLSRPQCVDISLHTLQIPCCVEFKSFQFVILAAVVVLNHMDNNLSGSPSGRFSRKFYTFLEYDEPANF